MKSKNIYSLPFKKDTLFLAISDSHAHFAHGKHAIDFAIDFNVPILAAFDGEVIDVKDDSNEGGPEEKYARDIKYLNYLTLKHPNGEYSQYGHIAHKSSLVKVGDKVKKGHPIAKGVGMIGSTTTPHVHLLVCIDSNNKAGFESLEIQFDRKIKIIRNGEDHFKALAKPKFKRLRELQEKYLANSASYLKMRKRRLASSHR